MGNIYRFCLSEKMQMFNITQVILEKGVYISRKEICLFYHSCC